MTAEDGLADTVRPRLDEAKADVKRIFALTAAIAADGEDTGVMLDENLKSVSDAIKAHDAKLLIIDPLMSFLGSKINSWKDQDIRRVLTPLSKLGEETGCAIIGIRHLKKSGGTSAIYRGGGSIGLAGAARSVLLIAESPDNRKTHRIIAAIKSNLAPPQASIMFHLDTEDKVSRVIFDGISEMTAEGLIADADSNDPEERSCLDDAKEWLKDILETAGTQGLPEKEIKKAAKDTTHTEGTLKRAKKSLNIKSQKVGLDQWYWRMPYRPTPVSKVTTVNTDETTNTVNTSAVAEGNGGVPPITKVKPSPSERNNLKTEDERRADFHKAAKAAKERLSL
jgi:hypothetical protein